MNEQLYITFENYLHNELSAEEQLEFENQLRNDKEMQEKFELYKETTQFLSAKFDTEAIAFQENLKSISREHFSETKSSPKVMAFKPWHYAVAASLVIGLGLWFMMPGNPQYSDYDQHENAYFMERGIADENLKNAQNAFNAKDYKKAAASFDKVLELSPEEEYFYAIALIETNEYALAETLLNKIKSEASVYKYKATWYLALSNLKQKKFDDCKTYLNQIPADAEDYAKAQKLTKDLD